MKGNEQDGRSYPTIHDFQPLLKVYDLEVKQNPASVVEGIRNAQEVTIRQRLRVAIYLTGVHVSTLKKPERKGADSLCSLGTF